jgi:hypothetical protein
LPIQKVPSVRFYSSSGVAMKTSLTLATILLLLAACDSTGPDPIQPPTGDQLTLQGVADYAAKIAPDQATRLLVVGQAAYVYNAAIHDGGGFISNERGFQRATWYDQDVRRAWAQDCWAGTPTFPGSDQYDVCGGTSGPFTGLSPQEILQTTMAMVRAIAGVDGYQLLWSTVTRNGDYQDYELCYATPDGNVYYWRWTSGLPTEQS